MDEKILYQYNRSDNLEISIKKHIEECGRICYASEDRIDENSYDSFYRMLVKSGHMSVLEHAEVCFFENSEPDITKYFYLNDYLGVLSPVRLFPLNASECFVITNARFYLESINPEDTTFSRCVNPEEYLSTSDFKKYLRNSRITIKASLPIAITREINRHRCLSISEMSTRYVNLDRKDKLNYYKDTKFQDEDIYIGYDDIIYDCFNVYCSALENHIKPEIARGVLPLNTMSNVVYTAFLDQWIDIYQKRQKGGHPYAKNFMSKVEYMLGDSDD